MCICYSTLVYSYIPRYRVNHPPGHPVSSTFFSGSIPSSKQYYITGDKMPFCTEDMLCLLLSSVCYQDLCRRPLCVSTVCLTVVTEVTLILHSLHKR